jgi:hypothetical protein
MGNPNLNTNKDMMQPADAVFENSIRPSLIDEFSGQGQSLKISAFLSRLPK